MTFLILLILMSLALMDLGESYGSMAFYLILMSLASFVSAARWRFFEATLALGRSLYLASMGVLEVVRSYQQYDIKKRPVTLPRILDSYSDDLQPLCLAGGLWFFSMFGFLAGVGFFIAVIINLLLILPKKDSEDFRHIVVLLMRIRCADYMKSGDTLRASYMAKLSEGLRREDDVVPDETTVEIKTFLRIYDLMKQENKTEEEAMQTIVQSKDDDWTDADFEALSKLPKRKLYLLLCRLTVFAELRQSPLVKACKEFFFLCLLIVASGTIKRILEKLILADCAEYGLEAEGCMQ